MTISTQTESIESGTGWIGKRRLTRFGMATAMVAIAPSLAFAQSGTNLPDEAGDPEARQETVVVTGSLIPQAANLVGTSPVSTIDAEEFDLRGVIRAEDLINTLPQAFGAQGATLANGATGTASINLRGLGSSRTLVLLNGRRLPYGSVNIAAPDINTIPVALVERVDVLTGGASATYGSDAIAGVTNFILDTDFSGVQFETNYSFYQHNNDNDIAALVQEFADLNPSQYQVPDSNVIDGEGLNFSLTVGGDLDDGKGHITAYATYQNVN
ncbi:MAG: TonB-dependent receptor plug domain-containing protein, partial [Pseudomonadota bacterium]